MSILWTHMSTDRQSGDSSSEAVLGASMFLIGVHRHDLGPCSAVNPDHPRAVGSGLVLKAKRTSQANAGWEALSASLASLAMGGADVYCLHRQAKGRNS